MPASQSNLMVRQLACLDDNYGFLVHDPESGETACIDTPDPDVILAGAADAGWTITAIWNTHHHYDHAGGNGAVVAATGAKIIAPASEAKRIKPMDQGVVEGDIVMLGRHAARVIETPGHTTGHVIYHFFDDAIAFVGDTLFAMGCGRLFEGTPQTMWDSLAKLTALPDETLLYCAHEYTQANARFALSVDADNTALIDRAAAVDAARARGEPTVPTTLALEKATNPFLRAGTVDEFARRRKAKDVFR